VGKLSIMRFFLEDFTVTSVVYRRQHTMLAVTWWWWFVVSEVQPRLIVNWWVRLSEVQALLSFSISFFSFFFHHPLLSSLLLPTDDIA
jgi:hypothetical protein